MKKLLALLTILALAALPGCSLVDRFTADPTPTPEPTATPAPASTAAPTPGPSPTPFVEVAPKDYEYRELSNSTLGVAFSYPSHWINEPGKSTIAFAEPVEEGDISARIAVTVKDLEEGVKITPDYGKKQIKSFLKTLEARYDRFKSDGLKNNVVFLNRKALSCTYYAYKGEAKITGFVIMTVVEKKKKIYALHMCAPSERYDALSAPFKKILFSVKPA